jgi:hypothetical protein
VMEIKILRFVIFISIGLLLVAAVGCSWSESRSDFGNQSLDEDMKVIVCSEDLHENDIKFINFIGYRGRLSDRFFATLGYTTISVSTEKGVFFITTNKAFVRKDVALQALKEGLAGVLIFECR